MSIEDIYEIYDSAERKWLVDNCDAVRALMAGNATEQPVESSCIDGDAILDELRRWENDGWVHLDDIADTLAGRPVRLLKEMTDCLASFEAWMVDKRLSTEKAEGDVPPFKNRRVEAMWEGFICAWGMRQPEREMITQWRPIETAPKDGTAILLYKKNKTDKYWCIVQASWFEGRFYADSKEDIIDWEDGILTATHWKPLPTLPDNRRRGTL